MFANQEELRNKCGIMTTLWLLAQMLPPGCHLYSDLTKDLPGEMFLEENFLMYREIYCRRWLAPIWDNCTEYEFQLRKQALRLTHDQNLPMQ